MSRFVRVRKAPEELGANEYVIHQPSFMSEVKACSTKRPKNDLVSLNYLREVIALIGEKYAGPSFNAMTDINVANYKNIPYEGEEKFHKTLMDIFRIRYPRMLELAVEQEIKQCPKGTQLIYFTGDTNLATVFVDNGIDEVLAKELEKENKAAKKQQGDKDK